MPDTPNDRRAGLPPPQFKLATMLWGVAVLAGLFACVSYLGLHSALILMLFALAVAAHVAGNALGTQLRSNGDRPLPPVDGEPLKQPVHRIPTPADFAPSTQLRDHRSLGRPIVIATIVGGVGTALLGSILMVGILSKPPTWTALIAGTLACGTLGAIWTFIGFGFVQVAWGALGQARGDVEQNHRTSKPG